MKYARRMRMKLFIRTMVLMLTAASWASAQKRNFNTPAALAGYTGADREKILFEGAKSEGKIVWYTSLSGGSYKALAEAFEAKYPGVEIEVYRAAGSDLAVRMTQEAQARRNIVDALETTQDTLMSLGGARLLGAFNSPHIRNYPEQAREKADKGLFFWTIARESYVGLAYNKKKIPLLLFPKALKGCSIPF
jgi:hypothetical protein